MTVTEVALIVALALAVYVPKVVPLVLISGPRIERWGPWLRYVAPAVLGALVAPAVFTPDGYVAPPGPSQIPFAVAFVGALLTRKMVPSLAAGLVALIAVSLLPY